jgi:hypothetical protein
MMRDTSTPDRPGGVSDSILRGVGVGLLPAAFLFAAAIVTYGLAALVRVASAGLGFFTQLNLTTITIAIGLLSIIVGFVVVVVRVFRQARAWRDDGETTAANAALWGVEASALLVVVPVLVAILLPQHPAYIK